MGFEVEPTICLQTQHLPIYTWLDFIKESWRAAHPPYEVVQGTFSAMYIKSPPLISIWTYIAPVPATSITPNHPRSPPINHWNHVQKASGIISGNSLHFPPLTSDFCSSICVSLTVCFDTGARNARLWNNSLRDNLPCTKARLHNWALTSNSVWRLCPAVNGYQHQNLYC